MIDIDKNKIVDSVMDEQSMAVFEEIEGLITAHLGGQWRGLSGEAVAEGIMLAVFHSMYKGTECPDRVRDFILEWSEVTYECYTGRGRLPWAKKKQSTPS